MASVIRTARPDEDAALSALARRSKAYWGYADADLQAWREALHIGATSIRDEPTFVVEQQGRVCAVLQLHTQCSPWAIGALWVDPADMRQGHGRALMARAVCHARSRGQPVLAIDADPHALGFYRALGARQVGAVRAPVVGDPQRVRPQLRLPTGAASGPASDARNG